MLEFIKLELNNIDELRPLILQNDSEICNNTVGGIFMWRDFFSMEYALHNDTVIFKAKAKYNDIYTVFSLPLGKDLQGGIEKTAGYCHAHGLPVAFYAVTDEDLEPLRSTYKKYDLYTNENWSDYIYNATDLVTLEGRKYSGKRNHVNQFKRAYSDHIFEEINNENLPKVRAFYEDLCSEMTFTTKTAIEDHDKTIEVLENYETYGLPGGLLRIEDTVVAFSIGEIKGNVLFIHVEKADMRYKGVYQVINNEFARHFVSEGIELINREEDDGDLGLRTSKQSYHPCRTTPKYIFVVLE